MIVKVCVGSSCHLKGSYDVIEELKSVLKKYDVEDVIDLQASFCLGQCAKSVNVKSEGQLPAPLAGNESVTQVEDGFIMHNVNKDNAETVFAKYIYPFLNLK